MDTALQEDRTDEYSLIDMKFHNQIAQASHNRYMVHMFITIRGLMEQFIREAFIVFPGLLKRSLKFHKGINNAIKKRDKKKAAKVMSDHIQDIQNSLQDYYKKQDTNNHSGGNK